MAIYVRRNEQRSWQKIFRHCFYRQSFDYHSIIWRLGAQKFLPTLQEELLDLHPSEEIEMERWKKIAAELGNRTPVQVQSRVQKYFLKLQRAGLPIPGRAPPARSKNRYLRPATKKKFVKTPLLTARDGL